MESRGRGLYSYSTRCIGHIWDKLMTHMGHINDTYGTYHVPLFLLYKVYRRKRDRLCMEGKVAGCGRKRDLVRPICVINMYHMCH